METNGNECELGGSGGESGGDGGNGGDTGGGSEGNNSALRHEKILPLLVGPNSIADISTGFNALLGETYHMKNSLSRIATHSQNVDLYNKRIFLELREIADNTSHNGGGPSTGEPSSNMEAYLKQLNEKTVFDPGFWNNTHKETMDLISAFRLDVSRFKDSGGGGGSGSGDLASIQAMMQSSMSTIGSISGNTSSIDNNLRRMSGDLGSIASTVNSFNSTSSSQLGQVIGSLASINGMMRDSLNNGGGSTGGDGGGTGNNEPGDINYDKMPGSYNNPMFMAGSQYEPFCESQDCYFDIASVEQEYKDKQKELTDKYQEIGEDVKEIFDYSLSGNAEVPKCFELYSFNNKTYSVCPDASGYWETLAAILLFLFYMVALMIIFRR